MPAYIAPDLHPDVDWTQPPPQYDGVMKEYTAFAEAAVAVLRGGNALCPTATATTVRVAGGKGGDVITSGGLRGDQRSADRLLPAGVRRSRRGGRSRGEDPRGPGRGGRGPSGHQVLTGPADGASR